MGSSLKTRFRIARNILLAPGFFDAVVDRFRFHTNVIKSQLDKSSDTGVTKWKSLSGGLHFHSTYSDGLGTFPEIMDAAAKAGLDFVISGDHNTMAPAQDGWQEKYPHKPLLIIGVEVSVSPNSFLYAIGIPRDWSVHRGIHPQDAIDEVNRLGGMPIICLVHDMKMPWSDWNVKGIQGIEVINLTSIARRHINIPSLLWLIPIYRKQGMSALIRALATRPDKELKSWDKLTSKGQKIVGIGCLDSHAQTKIGAKRYPIPTYEDAFSTVKTHVLIPEHESASPEGILNAIREGRCFFSYDCFSDAADFRFYALNGDTHIPMGKELEFSDRLKLFISVPEKSLIRIFRNGRIFKAVVGSAFEESIKSPGNYRVEVDRFRRKLGPLFSGCRPWIYSNPIYIK